MDMASKLTKILTYWEPDAPNGYGGWTYKTPVELACRWEDRRRMVIDGQGREVMSSASAYVLQELDLEGYIREGSCASNMPNPIEDKDARRILTTSKVPSVDASETVYQVYV